MWFLHNGIPTSNGKDQTTHTCSNMDESQHHVRWKKIQHKLVSIEWYHLYKALEVKVKLQWQISAVVVWGMGGFLPGDGTFYILNGSFGNMGV